jgi:redox-sensitive bicupin YhaK (pirin superfamily)
MSGQSRKHEQLVMPTPRTVVREIVPETISEGAGVLVQRSIAGRQLDWLDPFLLLDHFGSDDPEHFAKGFPMHPHRGIETVTYLLEGEIEHRDSVGGAGTLHAGGVQWMTAGGGLMHEEMPRGGVSGRFEGFQLWVNLPARLKMSQPRYRQFGAHQIPELRRDDGTVVRIIAGEVDGLGGPVREIAMQPTYLDVQLAPYGRFEQPVRRGHAAFAYVFRGSVRIGADRAGDTSRIGAAALAILGDGDSFQGTAGATGARLLLVSGAPTREPIARYGPFVMNSRAEILQALNDLNNDTFVWREGKE